MAVHVSISLQFASSVSTQIATLRRLLLEPSKSEHEFGFQQAREVGLISQVGLGSINRTQGVIPLVITVNSADVMASLLMLKKEVEAYYGQTIKMTFMGGAEAHLLAPEIADAGVGILLAPPRSYPYTWEQRRMYAPSLM